MGGPGEDSDTRARLTRSYSNRTEEDGGLAGEPIDVAVAILVAGCMASIPSNQSLVAGMMQELHGQMHERFDRLDEKRLSVQPDSITRRVHTHQTRQHLSEVLLLRAINPPKARRNIQELLNRVRDGDLAGADEPEKTDVRYWTARLCATDAATLELATRLRDELRQTDPDMDLSVVDALLAEAGGDADRALRLLRDHDDSDSRTALFNLLTRLRGERDALAWHADRNSTDDDQFFNAVGWQNWAICMAKIGDWESAAQQLAAFEPPWLDAPVLALVEGAINAALLLPDEFRHLALEAVPIYQGVAPNFGPDAENRHARATICLEFAKQSLSAVADHDLMRVISEWLLWLRLMDPNATARENAHQEIRQGMENGFRAVELICFAWAFNIIFNSEPLRQHLNQRKQLGGLNKHELLADCLLSEQSMSPRDLAIYLEHYRVRLSKVLRPAFVTTMHVDALVRDNQTERARTLVTQCAAEVGEAHVRHLNLMIDAHGGTDPREQLEFRYRETGSLIDLKHLVSHLKIADDRTALRPLVHELFDREPTIDNALDVVQCSLDPVFFDHRSITDFLDANPGVLEQSDDLKSAKAAALFHAGRLREAREINDVLSGRRQNNDDLHLDINIAISSGDWERIAGIIDREWPRRNSHTSRTLMTLAQLAAQENQNADRALQLARLAVENAPDDPQTIVAAYWLHFRLDREDQADTDWLKRAFDLSSTEEGPLWRMDMQNLVTEWLPGRQNYLREVERKWLSGEIPMSLAASRFNVSMARLLLQIPHNNENQLDGRLRTILPIIVGGRNQIELQRNWTVGLDVTSIMLLSHLDLLKTAIDAFRHIKLAHDVLKFLFLERDEVRFHQPSLIEAAKQVLDLQSQGRLQVADDASKPPKATTEQVGPALAGLLQMARHDNGKVICVLPIHRVGSLMERQADTSQYDDLIVSTADFCRLLHGEGKIDAADHERATAFLNSQGQTESVNLPPSVLNGPIYIDHLAISYLQYAGILQSIAAAGLDIRIHADVLEEMHALIAEGDVGHELTTKIEGIRHVLREAVDSGSASFLPRTAEPDEHMRSDDFRFQATASLLVGSATCDALCIDDRYINSRFLAVGPAEGFAPIICLLDILHHLLAQGHIDVADHWTVRHSLRRSGFAFIPLESEELVHWLKGAGVNNGEMTESVELRILRQTTAHADSLDLSIPAEAIPLTGNLTTACGQAIVNLWEDEDLGSEQAAALADWVWRNLMTMAMPGPRDLAQDAYANRVRESISSRVACLFLPAAVQSRERRGHYTDWIEKSVLQPLRPANAGMIERALTLVREALSTLENDQWAYGNLFLAQLPAAARRVAITKDAEFSRRCGFETRKIFGLGANMQLINGDLFAAARAVLTKKETISIQDIAGRDVSVGFDNEAQDIVVEWSDNDATHQARIPDLTLLSPIGKARLSALGKIVDRIGPTAKDFRYLLKEIESRELNDQELSSIFDESANGVVAYQERLIQKLERDSSVNMTDIIPQSISYFERLSGPLPDVRDPESYFHEVLIPYRKELLSRNLRVGLDICCVGALSDDLNPGQWVAAIDDDTIWDALSSYHLKSNPFSLLGALDVALYRQGGPRFREFAADAVVKLSADRFEQQDGPDIYELLPVFAEFALNRINLLENGSTNPGYWKRMCAWVHAGLIARSLSASSLAPEDIGAFQQWTHDNMLAADAYAELVHARKEPLLFAGRMPPLVLRTEILARLLLLRSHHESEGREVRCSEDIDQALIRTEERGERIDLGLPGPLEGYKRPTESVPQDVAKLFEETWENGTRPFPWQSLVMLSRFFSLDDAQRERAHEAVKMIAESVCDVDSTNDNLMNLELAGFIAAASRDAMLADGIADAAVGVASRISEEEIQTIIRIMLQTAAAYEAKDVWFKWLEERLADIAARLPSPPDNSLNIFLSHLSEIEVILPVESRFHRRARSIALAGVA